MCIIIFFTVATSIVIWAQLFHILWTFELISRYLRGYWNSKKTNILWKVLISFWLAHMVDFYFYLKWNDWNISSISTASLPSSIIMSGWVRGVWRRNGDWRVWWCGFSHATFNSNNLTDLVIWIHVACGSVSTVSICSGFNEH